MLLGFLANNDQKRRKNEMGNRSHVCYWSGTYNEKEGGRGYKRSINGVLAITITDTIAIFLSITCQLTNHFKIIMLNK